jgi:hypothetical protein
MPLPGPRSERRGRVMTARAVRARGPRLRLINRARGDDRRSGRPARVTGTGLGLRQLIAAACLCCCACLACLCLLLFCPPSLPTTRRWLAVAAPASAKSMSAPPRASRHVDRRMGSLLVGCCSCSLHGERGESTKESRTVASFHLHCCC